jgi:hypothetical protein
MNPERVNHEEEIYDFQTTFRSWCNEGYSLLQDEGISFNNDEEKESVNLALRRMLALFIDDEEYEKCHKIKKILEEHFEETSPLYDFKEI